MFRCIIAIAAVFTSAFAADTKKPRISTNVNWVDINDPHRPASIDPMASIFVVVPFGYRGTRTLVVPKDTTTGYFEMEDSNGLHRIIISLEGGVLTASEGTQRWEGSVRPCYLDQNPDDPSFVRWNDKMYHEATQQGFNDCRVVGDMSRIEQL